MDESQEIKQSYLRKEILENNYDPNLFLEFLITKKGEIASDINNWTIEELKTVVSEFIKNQNESQKENSSPNIIIEDLPAAESQVLKINKIISTPFSSKDNEKSNENLNNLLYNEDGNRDWFFLNQSENERYSRYSFSNYNCSGFTDFNPCICTDSCITSHFWYGRYFK